MSLFNKQNWRYAIMLLLVLLSVLSMLLGLMFGAVKIPATEILSILWGNQEHAAYDIIWNIRLPRVLVAALVGIGLALSGAILQGVLRNPMADPHVIGVSSGAGVVGMAMILALPQYGEMLVPAAFAGAVATALLIYALAWKNGMVPVRLILAGVAVSAFLNSAISALLTFYSDRVEGALSFMVGSLSGKSWPHVSMLWPYILIGTAIALMGSRRINVILLGDGIAKSLGMRVETVRLLLIATASILAAASVSVVGLLGFVGLIVPHIARLIVGKDYRFLLPASVLLGVIVLESSDLIARLAFAPVELPVGVVMGALGAPFFLYLLRSAKNM
ncbi:FecCD family ABC transporter permease [Paenibacillus sp. NPDC057934]|uniref:FecCD family ABC transporter permease n=1 Tax=Paenibacillus sp. NPDC057934 TaxID=3346282 RepID=UPI0036DC310D